MPQCEEEHRHPWLVPTEEREEGRAVRGEASGEGGGLGGYRGSFPKTLPS